MKGIVTIFIALLISNISIANDIPNQAKAPVRIYLESFRNDKIQQLSVRVLAKTEKRYLPMVDVEVSLYAEEISPSTLLGAIVTASNGTGTYTFTQNQFEIAKNAKIANYFAVVKESGILKAKEVSISIEDVNLDVRYAMVDSVGQIHVHVSETDSTGNKIPQEDVEIKFLVVRPLSPLPIGDDYNTTDEKGNASMEFPNDLPGDNEGHLKILVRIVENDQYGSVEVSEIKKWGIPTFVNDKTIKRSLWASGANAPISLLLFINAMIAGVWGMIFYIIFKIFKIKKIGIKND
jgi:hypothetical protein